MDTSAYQIGDVDEVDILRMSEIEDVPEQFDRIGVQNLDETPLDTEEMNVKIWHIPPGDEMGVHGHSTQEEFYYILEGTFRVEIGSPGNTERYEAEAGTVFAASPDVARGYENIGESEGRILVVAAPNVSDPGIPARDL